MSGNNAYFTTSPAMLMKRWQAAVSPSPTPSLTPTPSACNCYQNVYVDVTSGGSINWTLCNACGPGGELFVVGNNQLITDPCCIDITTLSGTATFTIASYDTPCCGTPASPSATPSVTPTVTPSISITPSLTPTPTPTPSSCICTIVLNNTNAKGVTFDSAEVDATAVTYSSGTNFPIGDGLSGTFTTTQTGTLNFNICYTNNDDAAYKMSFTDCASNFYCCDILSFTSDCCNFADVVFDCNCTITVTLEQGNC